MSINKIVTSQPARGPGYLPPFTNFKFSNLKNFSSKRKNKSMGQIFHSENSTWKIPRPDFLNWLHRLLFKLSLVLREKRPRGRRGRTRATTIYSTKKAVLCLCSVWVADRRRRPITSRRSGPVQLLLLGCRRQVVVRRAIQLHQASEAKAGLDILLLVAVLLTVVSTVLRKEQNSQLFLLHWQALIIRAETGRTTKLPSFSYSSSLYCVRPR